MMQYALHNVKNESTPKTTAAEHVVRFMNAGGWGLTKKNNLTKGLLAGRRTPDAGQ
jgi:hypothetical protein